MPRERSRCGTKTAPATVRVTLPQFEDAACATTYGMQLFADVTSDTLPEVREICRSCPVQLRCLQWGVLYEDEGVWGGMMRDELRRERHRHGIKRQEPNSTWVTPRVVAA